MSKLSGRFAALLLTAVGMSATSGASVYDSFPVPGVDYQGRYGATMPYTRYDCNEQGDATLKNGASLKTSTDWDASNKATQASHQAYVGLPVGASAAWNVKTQGDGVTVRYTIKDSHVGGAGKANGYADKEGGLEFYLNGEKVGEVDITSYFMYQYFGKGSGSPSQSPSDAPNFCFDEKHLRLSKMAKPGDTLEVKCVRGEEVGVDFLELEVVPDALDPADDAAGRRIFNVTSYGARPNVPNFDNRSAFEKAFNAASAVGGIMFIPEGTWYMGHNGQGGHGILSLSGKNVKVMGAGIWYTNIQFTGWEQFGGGISGGNPSNTGGKSAMDNIEWCHMYINSNLSDRHGENAVYKCFMDIWCEGSVLHDIWEQHFECGYWFGDYNNANKKSKVKVINCRIRDNYADGVNFCRGTSDSFVYNCSVRNNGDDGLACWDDPALGSQKNNTFAYNTIEFIWRAGGVAMYGGTHQRCYNNYIADMFMSAGLHSNDIFTRGQIDDIVYENNVLLRCGTLWECWGRDYGAIDVEGTNSGTTFKNIYIYDAPASAIRVKGQAGITLDGIYVNGAGISGGTQSYSASEHSAPLGNIDRGSNIVWKGFYVVENSVPRATVGASLDQYKTWPWWDFDPGKGTNWNWISEAQADADGWLEEPGYPLPEGVEAPVNIFDTLRDYNFTLTGLDWITDKGKHSMYEGDKVTFKVRIDYQGSQEIEAGTKISLKVDVDGKQNFTYTLKDGFRPNSYQIVEIPSEWNATLGQHTFTATLDPAGKMTYETNRNDNVRVKNVNVKELEGEEPEITITTHSGPDMGVVKVYFENLTGDQDEVKVGDRLKPHAIVANYGSQTISLGSGKGVLWALGGSPEYNTGMLWDDTDHTIAPGEWIDVTPNGGGNLSTGGWNDDLTYTAKAETVDLWCRMDNPENYRDNNPDNDSLSEMFEYPVSKPVYNDNPDKADNLLTGGLHDYEDGTGGGGSTTGFDLTPGAVVWTPGDKEVQTGDVISGFTVRVDNKSNVAVPAGKVIRVTYYIDGKSMGTATYDGGIKANGSQRVEFNGEYTATAGGHTVKAVISNVSGELSYDNNSRERTFNAMGGDQVIEPATEYITGLSEDPVNGVHFVVRSVSWAKADGSEGGIRPGDKIRFTATVVNNGTQASPDIKHGIQWQLPAGNTDDILWCDTRRTGSQPGEVFELTSMGGSRNTDGTWAVPEGLTSVTAWFNDTHDLGSWDCKFDFPIEIASEPATVEHHDDPTGADDYYSAVNAIAEEETTSADDAWYTLQGIRVSRPMTGGIYIHRGRKVIFR